MVMGKINQKKRKGSKTLILDNAKRKVFKQCRDNMGSCREVGLILGVTDSTIRNLENARTDPTLLFAFKFSALFNKPLEELFPDLHRLAMDQIAAAEVI